MKIEHPIRYEMYLCHFDGFKLLTFSLKIYLHRIITQANMAIVVITPTNAAQLVWMDILPANGKEYTVKPVCNDHL